MVKLADPVPVLRMFDVDKAREFYLDYLGFTVAWEHRFEDGFPLYMEVTRDSLALHLSEHHGDACPGATVRVRVEGIDAFHKALDAKDYAFAKPGIEEMPWGAREVRVTDPFGNTLVFWEPVEKAQQIDV